MQTKRRTEITIETETSVRVMNGGTALCPFCGGAMVAPLMASQVTAIGMRRIYRLIESGRLHFLEPAPDRLLVCTTSLRARDAEPEENE